MLSALISLVSLMGGRGLKFVLAGLAGAALLGAGYLWGHTHASRLAMEESARAAQAQVTALAAGYRASLADYDTRLKAQVRRGDQLAGELAQSRLALAAVTADAKQRLAHVVAANPVCDLPAVAVGVLREQPARH